MKKLVTQEDKLLRCVPAKWAKFYKAAPKEFSQDYITKAGYTREEFLEHARATKLFDHHFYALDPSDIVYKEYEYVPHTCKGWVLNEMEMKLYESMPSRFTQDEFRKKRLEMRMPISSQDKMLSGTLFKHISLEGSKYFDLEKGMIKPILK